MSNRPTEDTSADTLIRDEIIRNQRIVEHEDLGKVRLRRPTPRMDRLIAAERQRQYHSDLRDPDILSKAELEQIFIRRGMWSAQDEETLGELSKQVGELMGLLNFLGYRSFDDLSERYFEIRFELTEIYEEVFDNAEEEEYEEGTREEIMEALGRYFRLINEKEEQVRPQLEDRQLFIKYAPGTKVDDLLDEADDLRDQLDTLRTLGEVRGELVKLQRRYTDCFVDSLEARTNRAEELAQLYYCCKRVLVEDDPSTDQPLARTFDKFMDIDPEIIAWLQEEMYFFQNNVPDSLRDIFSRHGFTQRMLSQNDESDDSPEHPTPSSDGEPQENPESTSSE